MDFPDERAQRARKKIFGVYSDFGQCTGENWSPLKGYDSNRLAGMILNILFFYPEGTVSPAPLMLAPFNYLRGGARPPRAPPPLFAPLQRCLNIHFFKNLKGFLNLPPFIPFMT